jgi:hypothetical protein
MNMFTYNIKLNTLVWYSQLKDASATLSQQFKGKIINKSRNCLVRKIKLKLKKERTAKYEITGLICAFVV